MEQAAKIQRKEEKQKEKQAKAEQPPPRRGRPRKNPEPEKPAVDPQKDQLLPAKPEASAGKKRTDLGEVEAAVKGKRRRTEHVPATPSAASIPARCAPEKPDEKAKQLQKAVKVDLGKKTNSVPTAKAMPKDKMPEGPPPSKAKKMVEMSEDAEACNAKPSRKRAISLADHQPPENAKKTSKPTKTKDNNEKGSNAKCSDLSDKPGPEETAEDPKKAYENTKKTVKPTKAKDNKEKGSNAKCSDKSDKTGPEETAEDPKKEARKQRRREAALAALATLRKTAMPKNFRLPAEDFDRVTLGKNFIV